MQKYKFGDGLKDGISIGLGYFSVSFTFGIAAVNAGIPVWIAVFISMTCLTSAGQFAGVGIMAAGGSLVEIAVSQLVINLRYSLMSISLSQKLDESVSLPHRFAVSFFNTDEIFAVASGKSGEIGRNYLYGLALIPYIGWAGGTIAGAVLGSVLPEEIRSCLGIAIYAMFVAIIIPAAKKSRAVTAVVLIAAALSCALTYLPVINKISGGFAIIICAVVAAAIGAVVRPIDTNTEEDS